MSAHPERRWSDRVWWSWSDQSCSRSTEDRPPTLQLFGFDNGATGISLLKTPRQSTACASYFVGQPTLLEVIRCLKLEAAEIWGCWKDVYFGPMLDLTFAFSCRFVSLSEAGKMEAPPVTVMPVTGGTINMMEYLLQGNMQRCIIMHRNDHNKIVTLLAYGRLGVRFGHST